MTEYLLIAIDSSSSMLARDFSPDRLESAKSAALSFINMVPKNTKIGIVSFAEDVKSGLHPTKDRRQLSQAIGAIKVSMTGGTNIGDALIKSANMLEQGGNKSVILLTDGQSNFGTDVPYAIEYLKSKGVAVYAIGIATKEGGAVGNKFVSKLGTESISQIAEQTGGKYFFAEAGSSLDENFRLIARLKKSDVSFDLSWIFLVFGLIFLILEWFLASTKYKVIP